MKALQAEGIRGLQTPTMGLQSPTLPATTTSSAIDMGEMMNLMITMMIIVMMMKMMTGAMKGMNE